MWKLVSVNGHEIIMKFHCPNSTRQPGYGHLRSFPVGSVID